jgi:hypothetical protein
VKKVVHFVKQGVIFAKMHDYPDEMYALFVKTVVIFLKKVVTFPKIVVTFAENYDLFPENYQFFLSK